jgi:hypothetical protein
VTATFHEQTSLVVFPLVPFSWDTRWQDAFWCSYLLCTQHASAPSSMLGRRIKKVLTIKGYVTAITFQIG